MHIYIFFFSPFSTRPQDTAMPEVKSILREVLPKQGLHLDSSSYKSLFVDAPYDLWTVEKPANPRITSQRFLCAPFLLSVSALI